METLLPINMPAHSSQWLNDYSGWQETTMACYHLYPALTMTMPSTVLCKNMAATQLPAVLACRDPVTCKDEVKGL